MKVARKNFQNGMPNCPHMIPARSNRGFGTWNANLVNDNFNVHEAYTINVVVLVNNKGYFSKFK
jgi:hypothetical protein